MGQIAAGKAFANECISACWSSIACGSLFQGFKDHVLFSLSLPVTIDSLYKVTEGRQSDIFHRHADGNFDPSCCFTIYHGNHMESLDLVTSNAEEARTWVTGLRYLMAGISDEDSLAKRQRTHDQYPLLQNGRMYKFITAIVIIYSSFMLFLLGDSKEDALRNVHTALFHATNAYLQLYKLLVTYYWFVIG